MNRRLPVACGVLVIALSVRLSAASAVVEDVPVPGGIAAFARAVAIEPAPDRGRFMFEVTRLVHENAEFRKPAVAMFLQSLNHPDPRFRRRPFPTGAPTELVPVPLTADIWSDLIFHRRVPREELVEAIVADRTASLLCHGLAPLDNETLAYLADHESVLSKIAERSVSAFAAFSDSVHIRANRMVPPGAPPPGERDEISPLWEGVVGEKLTRPDRFLPKLFEASEGRVAFLYDVIGQLDPSRRAFALGLWIGDPAMRLERFKALAIYGTTAYRDWRLRTQPFNRASHDLAMTLMRVAVHENGAPVAPVSRGFWSRVFAASDLPDDSARQLRGLDEEPFDAAWLAETIGSSDVRQRFDRLDQLAFGQRVFAGEDVDRIDAFVAARALARYRMLMLTLERCGARSPALYTSAARQAARIGGIAGHRGFVAQAQFQGGLALVARMKAVRTIDAATAERLITRLVAVPLADDGRYAGAVGRWIRDELSAAIPAAATMEGAIIAALSGPAAADGGAATRLLWEGQAYRLDLGAAERRRLRLVRQKQEALPIDLALDLGSIARGLSVDRVSIDDAQVLVGRLATLASTLPSRADQDDEDNTPRGLPMPTEAHTVLRKAVDDLNKAVRGRDVKRVSHAVEPLVEVSDDLLSQILVAFVYAVHIGDPDGAILLADDVSRRHDFGFAVKDGELRLRTAWSLPRQDVSPGVVWHVTGSLLGLDVALAPLALRRVNFERILAAPRLTSNQREVFAISLALMDPFALTDDQRDAIVEAVDRGRRRVVALTAADLDAIANELGMGGARRRAVAWTFAHERDRVESMLSLTELLVLGGGRLDRLHAWGMSALATTGCLCTRVVPPGRWPPLMGRPQLGLTATGFTDVNFRVAMLLKELQLPAALAPTVLSAAVQDFIDQVTPSDDADWITMARAARAITREQVEDYLAAATAVGPLVPDTGSHR